MRFVEEYCISLNASDAVLKAGYNTRNQNRIGAELLQHPLVAKEIAERLESRKDRMNLTADYVLTKIQDIVEKADKGEKLNEALRGLELLGKHLLETELAGGPDAADALRRP